jgi:hypothetical protein
MSKDKQDRIMIAAKALYEQMPGAPAVPYDQIIGERLWGEVDENRHFLFCEAIATMMEEIAERHACRCPLI